MHSILPIGALDRRGFVIKGGGGGVRNRIRIRSDTFSLGGSRNMMNPYLDSGHDQKSFFYEKGEQIRIKFDPLLASDKFAVCL